MTTTYTYATLDADSGRINVNADIRAFASADEARAYLLSAYNPAEWNHATAEVGPGRYGDYLMCVHSAPREEGEKLIVGLRDCEPFTADQLYVAGPGQHPGGRAWWIEPTPDVLIIRSIHEIEE